MSEVPFPPHATGDPEPFLEEASPPETPPLVAPPTTPEGQEHGGEPLANPHNFTEQTMGDLTSQGDVNVIGAIYQQIFESGEVARVPRVFAGEGRLFTNRQEAEILQSFVRDEEAITRMMSELERSRALVIFGERAIGKMTTALYVATQLADKDDLPRCTRIIDPLDRAARVPLLKLAGQRGELGGRVTVLVDVFDRENRDLLWFFAHLDRAGSEQLTEALRRNRSYLILTASTSDMIRVAGTLARHELVALDREAVARAFDVKLNLIRQRSAATSQRIDILSSERKLILERLATIPAVTTFIDDFASGTEAIETALRSTNDTGAWLQEVSQDFDAWCLVLALALASPTTDAEAAPWLDLDFLRRALNAHLREIGELLPPETASDSDGTEQHHYARTMFDDALLERCRAVVTKDPERLGDVVRFRDRGCASAVWRTLLSHNRRVLTQAIPLLQEIAVNKRSATQAWLRMVATRALGRIGEIDPMRLALPQIRRWAGSGDKNERALVGRLVQGALHSENASYRRAVLCEIDELADPSTSQTAMAARYRLLAAIAAYSQIGVYDPDYAMTRLGTIAVKHVAPIVRDIHVIAQLAQTANRHADAANHPGRAKALQDRRNRLADLAHKLSIEHAPAAMALEKAIVYLCVVDDSVDILAATRDWISKGGTPAGVLLAMLLLVDGIAADLLALTLETAKGPASPLLVSLASGPVAVEQFSSLLADIRGSVATLPSAQQHVFHQRFAEMLTELAVDAVAGQQYRSAVADVYVHLSQVRGRAFRGEIYALVGSQAFADRGDMQAFAVEVRKRITATGR